MKDRMNSTSNHIIMKHKLIFAFFAATAILLGCTSKPTNNDSFFVVMKDNKWGIIDQTGKFVVEPKFEELWNFDEGGLALAKSDGRWGYIDKSGEFVIEPKFQFAKNFAKNGLAPARVNENDPIGFIDRTGKYVIEPKFDKVGSFGDDGLAIVVVNGKQGFIDESGKIIIEPKYLYISNFDKNGVAYMNWDRPGAFRSRIEIRSCHSFAVPST